MTTTFADLGLPARLVQALAAEGMTDAFPVQAVTLPDALAGRDICGRAPTGSGKTLGFGIPLMVRISQAEPTKPTGLVLVPTRELAEQVQRAFVPLGRAQWRFIQAIYGGASFGPQIHSLRKGASVIVATPGRLLDIIEKGYCDLSAVEVCVIDEADRMADLGFMPDVRKILDMTPPSRQTMLWSATLDGDVNELIRDYMTDPVRHDLLDDVDQGPVDHRFVVTRPTERLDAAVALIEEHGPTIVFVKTRFGVDDVAEDLNRAGVKAGALHGARSQAVRQRVLEDFKRGRLQALVATDVAARGIHVDNVSLVLHYDMPDNDKDYTHRSGRTGRAGNAGLVIAFVPPSRQRLARQMGDAVEAEVTWTNGETPVERVPAGERETGRRDRATRDPRGDRHGNDWAPRPPRPDGPAPRNRNDDATRPAARDRNDWAPRSPRTDGPAPRDRNDWAPRPRRDDDRGVPGGRFKRDDRPGSGPERSGPGTSDGGRSGGARYDGGRSGPGRSGPAPSGSGRSGPSRSDSDRAGRPSGSGRPSDARGGSRPGQRDARPAARTNTDQGDRPWRDRNDHDDRRPRTGPSRDGGRASQPAPARGSRPVEGAPSPATPRRIATGGPNAAAGRPGGFRSAPSGRRRDNG